MCGGFDFGELAVAADGGDSGFAGAGNDEAARDELVAFLFGDVVLLAGDVGFVDFYLAFFYFCIHNDLIAERENHEVAIHNLVLEDLPGFAVPDDGGLLLGNEAHFVDSPLGADAVDNRDAGVGDSNKDEKEILVGANRDNHQGEDEVDEVENRQSVSEDDFANGVLVFGGGAVDATICLTFFDLFFGEAS